jgi:transcriptional regulator GlxA family with amidase domain
MTPTAWVLAARLRRAQRLLETTRFTVERVSELTGFGSSATFRSQFRNAFGTSPLAHRRSFTQVSG